MIIIVIIHVDMIIIIRVIVVLIGASEMTYIVSGGALNSNSIQFWSLRGRKEGIYRLTVLTGF